MLAASGVVTELIVISSALLPSGELSRSNKKFSSSTSSDKLVLYNLSLVVKLTLLFSCRFVSVIEGASLSYKKTSPVVASVSIGTLYVL